VNPTQESFTVDVVESASGAHVMKLNGPLTIRTLFDFQTVSRREMTKPTIIDLTGVPYMDSAGLGCVVSVFTSCQNKGLGFAVCGLSSRLQTLFEVTHVSTILPIFNTLEAAEAEISRTAK
jgi:anti-sigma B factor antagonist